MRKEKSTNCYYPNFLYMELGTTVNLRNLCRYPISDDIDAAFLHEYIHYLQDITTISGYSNIGVVCDRMRYVVTSKDKKLAIPIKYESIEKFFIKQNALNQSSHIGDARLKIRGVDIPFPTHYNLYLKNIDIWVGRQHPIEGALSLVVEFVYNGKNLEYNIGEYAISESMAYLIEKYIYPNALPSPPDFPYNVVEKIVNDKFPFLNQPEMLVALCDVSLMYQFPGRALYMLCNELKEIRNTKSVHFTDVYFIGYSTSFADKLNVENRMDSFTKMNQMAKQTFQKYFEMIPVWDDIVEQVSVIFDNALWLRKHAPLFMIDILKGKEINRNNAFKSIVTKIIGALCIKTDANEIYHFVPELNTQNLIDTPYCYYKIFYNIGEPAWVNYILNKWNLTVGLREPDLGLLVSTHMIHDIFFKSNTVVFSNNTPSMKCELFDWCKDSFNRQSLSDLTSIGYQCRYCPWENVRDRKRLDQCAFGRLWAAWRLDRKRLRPK